MFLSYLVYFSALTLEGLGSYISILGLSSKSSIILIILTLALDFSKIVLASVLYKSWRELNLLFKLILVPATFFLMVITTYGSYAFLLQEFSKTTANQTQLTSQYDSLLEERNKLQKRKENIDKQIEDVPAAFISQKKRMTEMFEVELNRTNSRLIELDSELPKIKTDLMKDVTQAGTMGSLAKAWGTTPDQTAKLIAFLMVLVIDPLAITMLMVANFLQIQHRKNQELKDAEKAKRLKEKEDKEIELKLAEIKNKPNNTQNKSNAVGITSTGAIISDNKDSDILMSPKPIKQVFNNPNANNSVPNPVVEQPKKKAEKIETKVDVNHEIKVEAKKDTKSESKFEDNILTQPKKINSFDNSKPQTKIEKSVESVKDEINDILSTLE